MKNKYKIITLCGSNKFKDDFIEQQKRLTLMGNMVMSPYLFFDDREISISDKVMLDDIQRQKINISDEIFVINKNGYIGESTKKEIQYAAICHKTIRYMEKNND